MASSSERITKRLHISGLTPSITQEDLRKRLSTFGDVKALEGFGLPDGLGQPRKFGYITIETTAPQLAKCLNILSGSTWKGTKLRIGDAKPDFRERLERERQKAAEEPPRKRRRHGLGEFADDMSLVTPDNAAQRPGWKVTPMGRVVRPMRMRPDKPLSGLPLPPPPKSVSKVKSDKGSEKKKRVKTKAPLVRSQRRLIDPTQWNSVHLKGVFLESVSPTVAYELDLGPQSMGETASGDSDSDSQDSDAELPASVPPVKLPSVRPVKESQLTVPVVSIVSPKPQLVPRSSATIEVDADIAQERLKSLNILDSLFKDRDDDDWMGRESVGSDIDEDQLGRDNFGATEADAGFEEVPMETDDVPRPQSPESDLSATEEAPEPADEATILSVPRSHAQAQPQSNQLTKLKDLFAPREEEAGFSLLGHLDLDLELDDEAPFPLDGASMEIAPVPISAAQVAAQAPHHAHLVPRRAGLTLDPTKPFFFPLPASFPFIPANSGAAGGLHRGRGKDALEVARERGWSWRDPSVAFWRADTEDNIRKRWEEQKVELTRDWKRRWREAGKVRRRRGGGAADDAS
ncbi:hypothetical protein HGRIS_005298 [Hohenbuehelia grisea]